MGWGFGVWGFRVLECEKETCKREKMMKMKRRREQLQREAMRAVGGEGVWSGFSGSFAGIYICLNEGFCLL